MKPFTAISVDDEQSAHDALRALLRGVEDIVLVRTYADPKSALVGLEQQRPDLLFLDIAMPGMSGLELLDALSEPPVTVLLTAHMEFALKAFELGVRDYLLKPVSAQRLSQSLGHIRPLLEAGRESGARPPARLSLKYGNGHYLIDPLSVLYAEAAGNFSTVHTEGRSLFVSETMKDLQTRLAPFGFLRIHKSYIVNMRFIIATGTQEIALSGDIRLPVGRTYRALLKDAAAWK